MGLILATSVSVRKIMLLSARPRAWHVARTWQISPIGFQTEAQAGAQYIKQIKATIYYQVTVSIQIQYIYLKSIGGNLKILMKTNILKWEGSCGHKLAYVCNSLLYFILVAQY